MIVAMEFEELYRKDGSYIDQGIVELRVRKFTSESVCKKKFYDLFGDVKSVGKLKIIGVVRKQKARKCRNTRRAKKMKNKSNLNIT